LLVVVVATAYLVGTRVAKHHVVAQGVYVVNELRAYELLAFVGIGNVFGQGYPRCLRPSAQPSAQALIHWFGK
jgi:hypothetical protein